MLWQVPLVHTLSEQSQRDSCQFSLETWKLQVSEEEADEVHKMLEEFRDEVNQEKVLRQLKGRSAASEGSVVDGITPSMPPCCGLLVLSLLAMLGRDILSNIRKQHPWCEYT